MHLAIQEIFIAGQQWAGHCSEGNNRETNTVDFLMELTV